jgi:cysteine sulfinate desulfinase/cysteine desulfurase-like protein
MGLSRNDAKASVWFSYGRGLDEALVDEAAARFQQAVERARSVVAV